LPGAKGLVHASKGSAHRVLRPETSAPLKLMVAWVPWSLVPHDGRGYQDQGHLILEVLYRFHLQGLLGSLEMALRSEGLLPVPEDFLGGVTKIPRNVALNTPLNPQERLQKGGPRRVLLGARGLSFCTEPWRHSSRKATMQDRKPSRRTNLGSRRTGNGFIWWLSE
jgi:hypothetical protein